MERYFISTLIITLGIPVVGCIIDCINSALAKACCRAFGAGLTNLMFNWLTFVGVVHHELSHALFCLLTGAKVKKIVLFKPEGTTLGKVIYSNRGGIILSSIQNALSAVAPVVIGFISEFILITIVLTNCKTGWQKGITLYLIISIFTHMTMSWQDIKMGLLGLPICAIIIFVICYIFKIDIIALLKIF